MIDNVEIRQLWADTMNRIDAFHTGGDSAPVLDSAALAQVHRMLELARAESTDGELPGPVLDAAARLHLCRSVAIPDGAGQLEYRTALALFSALAAIDVGRVLEEIRRIVAPDTEADFPAGWTGREQKELLVGAMASGYPESLNRIVDLLHRALRATPADHPNHVGYLCDLGSALYARFGLLGNFDDLERAIRSFRDAAKLAPVGHPDRGHLLCDLGLTLRARFDRAGQLNDLDEAVRALTEAATLASRENLTRVVCLSNLGAALLARFGQTKKPADLDAAVRSFEEAVQLLPAGHPELPAPLSNLAVALQARFEQTGQLDDLDRAIRHVTEAIRLTPTGQPNRAACLNTLGDAQRERFLHTGNVIDLNEAIRWFRESVSALPASHPDRAKYLSNVATTLHTRFERLKVPADAREAIEAWREAAAVATAPAFVRLSVARSWGALAVTVGNGPAAGLDGYAAAIELLPRAAWRGVDRETRERVLADWTGLASAAATCAIAAGQPARALELLERGRAVLWTQLLETRGDRAVLRDVAPELAERLDDVAAELEHDGGQATEEAIDRRMSLAHEWDTLVQRVREVLGPDSMLAAPAFDDLRAAAAVGPVVVVNVSSWRCDALIVKATEPAPQLVELPELTAGDARAQAHRHLTALQDYEAGERGPTERAVLDLATTETLGWLWRVVARPVLAALGYHQPVVGNGTWPRLWWCPTGPLTMLPLHAAAHHDQQDPVCSGAVIDRVISSYTPTLRALARARTAQAGDVSREDQRLLVVTMGSTPGQDSLPAADRSSARLQELFPTDRRMVLDGSNATHDTVETALERHAWVYFGCHGTQDLVNPSRSGLLLHDQPLTVADLAKVRTDHAEFAFLAACHTAVGGTRVPDEAINLTAALQYTGYSHAIGALWSVFDRPAARITDTVFRELSRTGLFDPGDTARVLHHAVRAERARFSNHPSVWAPFLHAGP